MALSIRVRDAVIAIGQKFPALRDYAPPALRRAVSWSIHRWAMQSLPDREYLVSVIFRNICLRRPQKVLFVGCHPYTAKYPTFFQRAGVECWTIDIDPKMARYGARNRHFIGDVTAIDRIQGMPLLFDVVILNGVLGFGVDTIADANRAFTGLALITKLGGLLVIGWDTDRGPDPSQSEHLRLLYRDADDNDVLLMPTRKVIGDHIYDLFIRT
jgi:hypothetical protein